MSITKETSSMLRIIILTLSIGLGLLGPGCGRADNSAPEQVSVRSAEEIIAAFAGQGLNLQRGGEAPGSVFQKELNGVRPQMYSLNGVDLPLYQFSSAEERAAGWKDFGEQTAAADLVPYKAYQEVNFLMFYIHGESAAEGIKFNDKLDKQLKAAIQGLITAE
jgi:hypothetical protein